MSSKTKRAHEHKHIVAGCLLFAVVVESERVHLPKKESDVSSQCCHTNQSLLSFFSSLSLLRRSSSLSLKSLFSLCLSSIHTHTQTH